MSILSLPDSRPYRPGGSRNSKNFAIEAARGIRSAAQRAYTDGVSFLHSAEGAGMDLAFLCDFAGQLLDQIAQQEGAWRKHLDNASVDPDWIPKIDTVELTAIHAKLEAEWNRGPKI